MVRVFRFRHENSVPDRVFVGEQPLGEAAGEDAVVVAVVHIGIGEQPAAVELEARGVGRFWSPWI